MLGRRQSDQDIAIEQEDLFFVIESADILGSHCTGAPERRETIITHRDRGACRSFRGLQNQIPNDPPKAAVLIPCNSPGDEIGLVRNVKSGSDNNTIASAHKQETEEAAGGALLRQANLD